MNHVKTPDGWNRIRFLDCNHCPVYHILTMVQCKMTDWHIYLFDLYKAVCKDCKDKEWLEDEK